MANERQDLDTILEENRTFAPAEAFSAAAHIGSMEDYAARYRESIEDPERFWDAVASELHWFRKWDGVLDESGAPIFKWFTGGRTNIA